MSGTLLLAGEEMRLRLTPHPFAFLGPYGLSLLILAWGLAQPVLLGSRPLEAFTGAAAWVPWWAGLVVASATAALLRQRGVAIALLVLPAVTTLASAAAAFPTGGAAWDVAVLSSAAGLAGLGATEAVRRSRQYAVTNFRVIVREGLLRGRERTHRLAGLAELSPRQGALGRLLDCGTLVPATGRAGAGPEVHGVRPLREIRSAIEALAHEAAAAPELRSQNDELRRIERLLSSPGADYLSAGRHAPPGG